MCANSIKKSKVIARQDDLYAYALSADFNNAMKDALKDHGGIKHVNSLLSAIEMSQLEELGIQLSSMIFCDKIFSEEKKPTVQSIDFFQTFFSHIIQNHDFQCAILGMIESFVDYDKSMVHPTTASILNTLLYALRHHDKVSLLHLNDLYATLTSEQVIEKKLCVSDMSHIADLASCFYLLQILYRDKWLQDNPLLLEIYNKAHLARHIANHLMLGTSSFVQSKDDGIILIPKNGPEKSEILKDSLYYFSKISKIFDLRMSPIEYVQEIDDEDIESPAVRYESKNDLEHILFADMCIISVDDIFSKEHQKILIQIYGKNWRDEISSMIKELENQLFATFVSFDANEQIHVIREKCYKIESDVSLCMQDVQSVNDMKYEMRKDHKMLLIKPKARLIREIIQILEGHIKKGSNDSVKCNIEKILRKHERNADKQDI